MCFIFNVFHFNHIIQNYLFMKNNFVVVVVVDIFVVLSMKKIGLFDI